MSDTDWGIDEFDARLPELIERASMKFELEIEQVRRYHQWKVAHIELKHPKREDGAIGGRFTFSFTHTQLGMIATVECACGEKLDLTDYASW